MKLKSRKSHESKSSFWCLGSLGSELRNKDGDGSRTRIILPATPLSQIAETGGFASPPRGGFAKETQAKAKLLITPSATACNASLRDDR